MADEARSQKRAKVEASSSSPSSPPLPRRRNRLPQSLESAIPTDTGDALTPRQTAENFFPSVDANHGSRDLHVPERNDILEAASTGSDIREDFVVEGPNSTRHPGRDVAASERNDIAAENSVLAREEAVPDSENSSFGGRDINFEEINPLSQAVPLSASAGPNIREVLLMERTVSTVDNIDHASDVHVSVSTREEQVHASTIPSEVVDGAITSPSVQQTVIDVEVVDHPEPVMDNPGKSSSTPNEKDFLENADSMTCPICMESWTSDGSHRICCLACGHLFGRSCIRRWLKESGKKNSKCPHCNRKARIEDIRNLYVPSLVVLDQQLHEDLSMLRKRNEELVAQNVKLNKELQVLQRLLADRDAHDESLRFHGRERHTYITVKESGWNTMVKGQRSKLGGYQCNIGDPDKTGYKRQQTIEAALSHHGGYIRETDRSTSHHAPFFDLQDEFSLLGARVFDMDALSQMILVAQKSPNGLFCLNKISLLSPSDKTVMPLPDGTGAVRDVRVAPPGGRLPGRLALVASLGKRLSLFSLESNNTVLTYTTQSPCWSCAWDPNEPNQVYAGCQDGSLTVFDLRQTSCPLRSIQGFSRQPVHTLQPIHESEILQNLRKNGILSACSSGVYFWEMATSAVEDCNYRPCPVPYVDSEGVCVALAYDHLANLAVSSFRPKPCVPVSIANGSSGLSSQISTEVNLGSHTRAIHVPLSRNVTSSPEESSNACNGWKYGMPMFGHVSSIGMHKSAIVCKMRPNSSLTQTMFAFGDDETHSVLLWDINNCNVIGRLRSHGSPVLDIKSMNIDAHSFIGCISLTTLQIYKG